MSLVLRSFSIERFFDDALDPLLSPNRQSLVTR
jgi:hypothetical protein